MNVLKAFLDSKGLTIPKAAREYGVSEITLRQHIKGQRNVSPEMAILYERVFGIPRENLRPDLWEKQSC